jgi:cell division protein FtsW (lipid II flippase)
VARALHRRHLVRVRLSRNRILFRVTLLVAAAAFLAIRSASVLREGRGDSPLAGRLAFVEALLAVVALLTALAAALSLRKRTRRRTLVLPRRDG